MIEKLIKKAHRKILGSAYGILGIINIILPFALIIVGIVLLILNVKSGNGIIWLLFGAVLFFLNLRNSGDIFRTIKYCFNPKVFPLYKTMCEKDPELSSKEAEIDTDLLFKTFTPDHPIIMTDSFIIGFTNKSFFIMEKEDLIWVYEYQGNGLVFYNKHNQYGFVFYPTVDGNDQEIAEIEKAIPYIYYGIDFNYTKVMHDDLPQTLEEIEAEKAKFEANPEHYLEEKKASLEAQRKEEEERLERQKEEAMASIDDGQPEEEEVLSPSQEIEENKEQD